MDSENRYYKFIDGGFTHYINVKNGKRKFELDPSDILVESKLDDFLPERSKTDVRTVF